MKIEGKLFAYGCVFYLIICAIYGFWSKDISGIVLLGFTGLFAFLIGFFALHTSRKVFPRPEDRDDGDQEDADLDYGFYSPYSWWPLPTVASCAIIIFGLCFAAWMVAAGVAFLMLSLVGFMFEYYRGQHAH